jgi:hypothetical protein
MSTQTDLDAAIAARHKLLIGSSAETVRHADGRSITYRAADLPALDRYIAELRGSIAGTTTTARRSRVIYVVPD